MVHRAAPPRLTGAFGLMLLAAGALTFVRRLLVADSSLTLAGGTSPTATLDVTDNDLKISNGNLATVRRSSYARARLQEPTAKAP